MARAKKTPTKGKPGRKRVVPTITVKDGMITISIPSAYANVRKPVKSTSGKSLVYFSTGREPITDPDGNYVYMTTGKFLDDRYKRTKK